MPAKPKPKPRVQVIQRIDKRQLAARMVDIAGMTQAAADEAIQGIGLAIGTWLEATVQSLPQDTQAELALPGVGRIIVTYQPDLPPSKWRAKHGLPPRPLVMAVNLVPLAPVNLSIRRLNRSIISQHVAVYRPLALATAARLRSQWREKQHAATPAQPTSPSQTSQPALRQHAQDGVDG